LFSCLVAKHFIKPNEGPVIARWRGFLFYGGTMTKEEKARYDEPEQLGDILKRVLAGKSSASLRSPRNLRDHFLGNDVTIRNGKEYKIICSLCGY
jgi:hypothetical protein